MAQLTGTELIKDEQGIRSLQTVLHIAEELGRSEDRVLAHVAPGEMVIPEGVLAVNPDIKDQIYEQFRQMGIDPEQYVVGSPHMSINPITGQPEFGFFKKIFKKLGKIAKVVAPIAINFIPGIGPLASAALTAGLGKASGLSTKQALLGGALSFAGGKFFGGAGAGAGGAAKKGIFGGTFGPKVRAGIGSFFNPAKGATGIFGGKIGPGIRSGIGSLFGGGQGTAEYTVQSGDTLSEIAAKNNTTVAALMKANPGITDPNLIYAGSTLSIPGQGGSFWENLLGGQAGQAGQADQTGLAGLLRGQAGQPQGTDVFGGGILDTLLKLAAINQLRKQESKDPAEVVPVGADAFSAVGQGGEGSPIDYRVLNLQPALMPGVAYANVGQPTKMEHGGITSLENSGDITPAWLEPGEFVMTKKATGNIGAQNLYKMMKQAEGMG